MAWKPKYPPDPPRRTRRWLEPLVGLAVILAIVLAAVALDRLVRYFSEGPRSLTSILGSAPPRAPEIVTQPRGGSSIIVRPSTSSNSTWPTGPDLTVVDGDTVRSGGATYRLVGFDTPERGDRALCDRERQLAERATARLKSLLVTGEPKLERVACACRAGTEGTQACNFGRLCAFLRVDGRDVGETLIGEGLAQPFVCGRTSCPPRRPWC
jgi:endonuclease YncB( thermonuclease family)